MRVAILRSTAQSSISMGVYADNIIEALRQVRPDWDIKDVAPIMPTSGRTANKLRNGFSKYYERYWNYPRSLKTHTADIFHVVDHSDGHLISWLKRYGKPSVVTCHDLINWVQPEMYKGLAIMPLVSLNTWRWSVKQMQAADHVITVSKHTAGDVTACLDISPTAITAIPNAVSDRFAPLTDEAIAAFRAQQGLPTDAVCLLNIGSNNPRKNVSAILKAVEQLKSSQQPVHFWKAGSDFNAAQREFIAIHQLQHHVSYLGRIDDDQLATLYSAADILVAPSLYEGFGLTVLEAMACKTPVITANTTSLPEVAGNAAILIDPEDPAAIAAAVNQLIQDPDRYEQLSKAGQLRAKEFTWTNTAHQIASVYEHVYSATH